MMVFSYSIGLPCRRNVIAELEDLVLCGVSLSMCTRPRVFRPYRCFSEKSLSVHLTSLPTLTPTKRLI